jgi:ubiquinone/menaquinone biosynthesis C-methylase UbiE
MENSTEHNKRLPENIHVFEKYYQHYDRWFIRNKYVYRSEVEALKKLIPRKGLGIEIGIGTGRFSTPFSIEIGLDPSIKMGSMAVKRGIEVVRGVGEHLPFRQNIIDFVLIVTTICFVKDPFITLKETRRILKNRGSVIIGFVDKNSNLGRYYFAKKEESMFYQPAKFYSTEDVQRWFTRLSFSDFTIYQTIFRRLKEIKALEPIKEGYGEGGFVVFKAKKVDN